MRRVLLAAIVLVLFSSPSFASVCSHLRADLETAKAAHEQAAIEFEAVKLAYDQTQIGVDIADIKRHQLRSAFQVARFNNKIAPHQRVQARADWQQAVDDFRTKLDDLRRGMDTLDRARNTREQAYADFESARLAYDQARKCSPLGWVRIVASTAEDAAETAVGVAVAAAVLAAYPLYMAWPFLAF